MVLILRILIFLVFLSLLDWYSYQAFKTIFPTQTWIKIGCWIFSIAIYLFSVFVFLTFDLGSLGLNFGRLMSLLVLSILPKLIILIFLFGEDEVRFFTGVFEYFCGSHEGDFLPNRRKFISQTALVFSAIPFLGILHVNRGFGFLAFPGRVGIWPEITVLKLKKK